MHQKTVTDIPKPKDAGKSGLAIFLHELNIARRNLTLYPAEHPRIIASIDKTLYLLNELFQASPVLNLGISPESIYFQGVWLDNSDPAIKDFAHFFSSLGIASVIFSAGITSSELIGFNQLLRRDRSSLETSGGIEQLMARHNIEHIQVISVDYDAFQARKDLAEPTSDDSLWEAFLHGLQQGILEFEASDDSIGITTIAELLNHRINRESQDSPEYERAMAAFIERSMYPGEAPQIQTKAGRNLSLLLDQLTPEAKHDFLLATLRTLDKHQDSAPNLLTSMAPNHIQEALSLQAQNEIQISSRLVDLVQNFAGNTEQKSEPGSRRGPKEMPGSIVRARLNELFKEEQQEMFLPDNYKNALQNILDTPGRKSYLPEDARLELKEQFEAQSVERQISGIIFFLLDGHLDAEQEEAVQKHLVELSRFFLDTGDFSSLRDIYEHWSHYLHSGRAHTDLLNEKVLSAQTQLTFLTEVLDGFDVWDKADHDTISAYIAIVGEPYVEHLIERLASAPHWTERRLWLSLLKRTGHNEQEKILNAIDDERWYVVRNLLIVLGRNVNQTTLKTSLRFCSHSHPMVRIEAIRNLFTCNPATANRQLLKELRGDDLEAVHAALDLAGLSRDKEVIEYLHKSLEHKPADDTDLDIQKKIVTVLPKLDQRESVTILRRILLQQGFLTSRRTRELQKEAIKALPHFKNQAAEKLLSELSSSRFKKQVRDVQKQISQEEQ